MEQQCVYTFTNIHDKGKRFTRDDLEYRYLCRWKSYPIELVLKQKNIF